MKKRLRCHLNVSIYFNRKKECLLSSARWVVLEEIRCCFKLTAINLSITIFVCQLESFRGFFGVFFHVYCLGQLFQGDFTTLVKIIVFKLVWKWNPNCILWLLNCATFAPGATIYTLNSARKAHHTTLPATTACHYITVHCAQNQNGKNREFVNRRHL